MEDGIRLTPNLPALSSVWRQALAAQITGEDNHGLPSACWPGRFVWSASGAVSACTRPSSSRVSPPPFPGVTHACYRSRWSATPGGPPSATCPARHRDSASASGRDQGLNRLPSVSSQNSGATPCLATLRRYMGAPRSVVMVTEPTDRNLNLRIRGCSSASTLASLGVRPNSDDPRWTALPAPVDYSSRHEPCHGARGCAPPSGASSK